MASSGLYVGVDGGSTKTHIVCLEENGELFAECTVGPSNYKSVEMENAWAAVKSGIEKMVNEDNFNRISGVALTMSGIDVPKDKELWIEQIGSYFPVHCNVIVENDCYGGLCSGTNGVPEGIVAICGTGSNVMAWNEGVISGAGGYGPQFLDNACGLYLGQLVLRAISLHHDGGERTKLYDLAIKFKDCSNFNELFALAYAKKHGWDWCASFAILCFQCLGDNVAERLINEVVEGLGVRILLCLKKMDKTNIKLVCIGSLLHNPIFFERVTNYIKKKTEMHCVKIEFIIPEISAAHGAALAASSKKRKESEASN